MMQLWETTKMWVSELKMQQQGGRAGTGCDPPGWTCTVVDSHSGKAPKERWKGRSNNSTIGLLNWNHPAVWTWKRPENLRHSERRFWKTRPDVSTCPDVCIKKDSLAVRRLKSLSWRLEWRDAVRAAEPASLELGSHLQEGGLLLHDAHQQRVNVVLQIFDLRLQLLQLNLPLRQQTFLPLKLCLLLLKLRLPLNQQSHQVIVVQVVVRAGSSRHQLSNRGRKILETVKKGLKAAAALKCAHTFIITKTVQLLWFIYQNCNNVIEIYNRSKRRYKQSVSH